MNDMNIKGTSVEQMTGRWPEKFRDFKNSDFNRSFDNVFEQIKFSKHAAKRLDDRQISLSQEQNERLTKGVVKAGEKGIKDSLVMVDDMAFIVNVPNRTVITAMDEQETTDHIFTNIDGTVIA